MDENDNSGSSGQSASRFGASSSTSFQQPSFSVEDVFGQAQVMTAGGYRAMSKDEHAEAAKAVLAPNFSYEGYQVVRREFFSHSFDPTLTIRGNSIIFNNSCISKLEQVVYVQVLVNPAAAKLVIRPCSEGARDAIRWCVAKEDQRKSRQIVCGLFTAKLYTMLGWGALYCYKLQGARINYKDEQIYVFDLSCPEAFLPKTKKSSDPSCKPARHPPMYPADWRDSFGLSVKEHALSTQVNLLEDFDVEGVSGSKALPPTQLQMELLGQDSAEVMK